jgi:hypothetical protein
MPIFVLSRLRTRELSTKQSKFRIIANRALARSITRVLRNISHDAEIDLVVGRGGLDIYVPQFEGDDPSIAGAREKEGGRDRSCCSVVMAPITPGAPFDLGREP